MKVSTRKFENMLLILLTEKGLSHRVTKREKEMEHEIGSIFEPLQIDNIFSIDKHDDLLCHLKKEILSRKLLD